MPKKYMAFVSYAREDSDWAARLVNELQAHGIGTWFDRENLLPGQGWDLEIRKAIEDCQYFLAILSRHSVNKSGVVQSEVKRALAEFDKLPAGSTYFIPIRIDDCEPTHPELRKLHRLDLFDDWESGIDKLLSVISGKSKDGLLVSDARLRDNLGRFRHAILGPVQGLTSAARLLVEVAREAGADADVVERLSGRINQEAETIRLWRENQRVYLGTSPKLTLRKQPLRPTIERVAERFRSILAQRELGIEVVWRTNPDLVCSYDDTALDIILSNLLDNAAKYSFYNRPVILGVERERTTIRLWVEDIGHGLPVEMRADSVSSTGKSMSVDPVLRGEGLGLKVVRSLTTAHGGDVFYDCWPLAEGKSESTTPYRVRFVVTLKGIDRAAG